MDTLIFIFIGVIFNAAAQIFLKIGMGRIGHFHLSPENFWPVALQIATSIPVLGGLFCYVFSLAVWLIVLSRVEVSFAYPLVSIGYVVTALAAYFWLGEQVGPMRLAGIIVIMLGVFMVSRTA
jgi:multidrug transporter EmrE-like cation transporter